MTPTPRAGRNEATASALRRALRDEANQVVPTDRWSEIESQLGTGSRHRWTRWVAPLTVAAAAGTIAVLVWTTTTTGAGSNDVGPAGTGTSTVSVSPDPSAPAATQRPEDGTAPTTAPSAGLPAASEAPGAVDRSPQARPESAVAAPETDAAQIYPPTNASAGDTAVPSASDPSVQSSSQGSYPSGPSASSDAVEVPQQTTAWPDGKGELPATATTSTHERSDGVGAPYATGGSSARKPGTSAKPDRIALVAPTAPVLARDNVRIVGGASVHLGVLSWQLSDDGGPVASGFAKASVGAPDWGSFAIELGTLDPGSYTVWVWSDDPKGGEAMSQAKVGFTVG